MVIIPLDNQYIWRGFFMKVKIIICLSLFLIILVTPVIAAQVKTGEIVAVNGNHPSILLDSEEEIKEYSLALNNSIKLNGREVSINALKPIKDNVFQEAVIETNDAGKIIKIESFYQAVPIVIKEVKEKELIVKDLNNGERLGYDIREDLNIKKNNHATKLNDIRQGEQGILILGIENRARKIVLHNYSELD